MNILESHLVEEVINDDAFSNRLLFQLAIMQGISFKNSCRRGISTENIEEVQVKMDAYLPLLMMALISLTVAKSAPGKKILDITVDNIDFLSRYGYYQAPDPQVGRNAIEEDLSMSLKRLQRFANIPETGVMDEQTRKFMNTPRCGVPDFGPSDNARRKRRFVLQGSTWKKRKLSWRLTNNNNDGLTRKQVRDTIRQAFGKWQAVANLNFYEIYSAEADIMLSFMSGYHGDYLPFDRWTKEIAHAFFPYKNFGRSGDVHYNDDKTFTLATASGYNLLWITVHELGHSLGLDHSNVKGSIMHPEYPGYLGDDFKLKYDDIVGIQSIYGPRIATGTRNPNVIPPTSQTIIAPKMCPGNFRAIFYDRGSKETYVVNHDKVYILSKNLGVKEGPTELNCLFTGLDRADAVYVNREEHIVFFKGDRYYIYESVLDGQLLEKGSIYDRFWGLSREVRKVDAAFIGKNGHTYIFAGDEYYRYDEFERSILYGYPRKINSAWHGVPNNVEAVFIWRNDVTYFFKSTQFYRMDDSNVSVQKGYPRDTAKSWSRC